MRDATVAVGAICLLIGFAAGRGAGGVSGLAVGDGYQALAPAYDAAGGDLPLEVHVSHQAWTDCADDGGLFTVDPNAADGSGKVDVWCDVELGEGAYTGPTHVVNAPTTSVWAGDTPALAYIPVPDWTRCAEAGGVYTIEPFMDGAAAGCWAPVTVATSSFALQVQGMDLANDALYYVSSLQEDDGESGPIVVERLFEGPDELYDWRLEIEEGGGEPLAISIVSSEGLGGVTYPAVFPVRWGMPPMDAASSGPQYERITFQAVDSGSISRADIIGRKPSRVVGSGSRPPRAGLSGREDWGRQR